MSVELEFIAGLALLILGGELLVRGAVAAALKARIAPLIVGLTVVSFGTSAPELFTSLSAALNGSSNIAVGNVIGSNIANIALILGLTALLKPVLVDRRVLYRDAPVMILASLAMWWVVSDLNISANEGGALLLAMVVFIGVLVGYARKDRKAEDRKTEDRKAELDYDHSVQNEVSEHGELAKKHGALLLAYICAGMVGLYFGSGLFVEGAQGLAKSAGVSDRVIGLTVVAFGTSVPELVASLIAVLKGHSDLALGNVVGSNLFNILLVLGATALIKPLDVDPAMLSWDIWWMLGLALLLIPLAATKKINRVSGLLLLTLYIAYIATTWPI
jgi:cation:H+ antiporter